MSFFYGQLQPKGTVVRMRAAAAAYTDTAGRLWSPEIGFTNVTGVSGLETSTNVITNTYDQVIFRANRYGDAASGSFRYVIPVTPGLYSVRVNLIEYGGDTTRRGNISVNGTTVFTGVAIMVEAGAANVALIKTVHNVRPVSGNITVLLTTTAQYWGMSGIEILPV